MASEKKYIDLLMVGKTGNGKSATGNSILRKKAFKSRASMSSITRTAQFDFAEFENCTLKVVDGPGIGDTKMNTEDAVKLVVDAMTYAIAANPAGYHAILVVVRFGQRFTEEDVQCVQLLKEIFGEDFIKYHAILVLTCGDSFEHEAEENNITFEQWCKDQEGAFTDLLKECRNRVTMIDNITKDEDKKDDQIRKLLKIVDGLAGSGVRYNNENFIKAQQARERMFLEAKRPKLTEETLREVGVITQQFGRIDFSNPKGEMSRLQKMKERADALEKSLNEQDKGTNALSVALNLVKNLQESLDEQIERMNETLAMKMKEEKIEREIGWVAEPGPGSGVSTRSSGSVRKLLEQFKTKEKDPEEENRRRSMEEKKRRSQDEQRIIEEERKRKEKEEAREREEMRQEEKKRESLRLEEEKLRELRLEEEKRLAAKREEEAREAEKHALEERERMEKHKQSLEELLKMKEEREKKQKEAQTQSDKLEEEYQKMKAEETQSYLGFVVDAVTMPIKSFSKWWWGE